MRKLLIAVCVLLLVWTVPAGSAQDAPVGQVGEVITVQGVAEIVSSNVFRLLAPTPLDVGAAEVVVFPATTAGFDIDVNSGMQIEVTGELLVYDFQALANMLPYALNSLALAGFDNNDYAIIASSVTDLTEIVVLDESAVVDIEADPTLYHGEMVTVQGYADILSGNVFRLLNTEPFNLTPNNLLVVPDTLVGFTIDINHGMWLQVTGRLQTFSIADLEASYGYDLNEAVLQPYDLEAEVIVASSVIDMTDRTLYDEATIIDIEANPEAFVGETLNVSGVAQIVSSHAFEITDTTPFTVSPARIVVLPETAAGFWIDINNSMNVTVTGTLAPFRLSELQAQLGYDLNEAALAGYGPDDYALISLFVSRNN